MTLYELLKITQTDFDTYDTVFDACVTACAFDKDDEAKEDFYYKFFIGLTKFVTVLENAGESAVTCDWSEMIKRNFDVFKDFTRENWAENYDDDEDEFIYQWIEEINGFFAGFTSENVYKDFVENYMPRLV